MKTNAVLKCKYVPEMYIFTYISKVIPTNISNVSKGSKLLWTKLLSKEKGHLLLQLSLMLKS